MNSSGSDQTSAKAPPHLLTLTMNVLQRSKNSMTRNLDVQWSMYVFTIFHRISFAQAVTRATTCGTKHAARLNQGTISRRSYLHISPTIVKLTYPLKIDHPKRKLVFQPSIFGCYVRFKEDTSCFTWILNIRFTQISAN